MMNDDFLYTLRDTPDAAFAERLRGRLRQQPVESTGLRAWPVRRVFAGGVIIAAITVLFSLPAVRTSAQSFLAMFREVNFVAIPVDNRVIGITGQQLDLTRLLGEHVQVIQEPGLPVTVLSVDAAAQSAGFAVAQPSWLPEATTLAQIQVQAPRVVRVTADADRLREILRTLGIRDLEVPQEVDGQVGMVQTSSVVRLGYDWRGIQAAASLYQTPTPNVSMPAGLDLPRLGEIVLRILGLPRAEAHRFAQTIDWHSTVLVPVPPNASSFRQVDIGGHQGVSIETIVPGANGLRRRSTLLFWSVNGRVFAMEGSLAPFDLLQMAKSLR
jgi:hypothetical protein